MTVDLRDLVRYYMPNFPARRVGRLVTDTTDFTSIDYGDVISLGDLHYMVLRDEAERRFGLEDFKFWVKRCRTLETGQGAILKLVFHEEFSQQIGPVTIRSFRSPSKEARILDLVKDDPRFMHGFTVPDEVGNPVRVLEIVRGKRLDLAVDGMPGDHWDYFHKNLRSVLAKFVDACEAIAFMHAHDEQHGDIRRDHLWVEGGTGLLRWIDFDYAFERHANPWALDLFGLGNILLFLAGKRIYGPDDLEPDAALEATRGGEFSLIFKSRLVNLRRLFPYIPKPLNNVLMHFSARSEVYYETVDEFLADLRPCLELLPEA